LTDDDFQKASPEKTKIININEFVDEREVDAMFYETPYYLEPEKSGAKAYVLLREALSKTGKAGFGSYVLRNRESLCLIKPRDELLVLIKIRFAEEIRSTEEIKIPDEKIKPAELKMAVELIDRLTGKFDIASYKDTYSADLMKLIKAKSKGQKPTQAPLRIVHSRGKDLMSQLKASLEGGGKKKKAS
jgi:DNA end-binding protein Ku